MTDESAALDLLDELDRACERRATAWVEEATAWADLGQALTEANILALAHDVSREAEAIVHARQEIVQEVEALVTAGDELIHAVDAATAELGEIVHDTAAAAWHDVGAALQASTASAADHLRHAEKAFVEALGTTAVAKLAEAEETVGAAVTLFHDALPDAIRDVAASGAALKEKVSTFDATFHADMVALGAQLETEARNLGLSLLRQQLAQEAALVQRLAQFGDRVREAVRTVETLTREVAQLRTGLDRSVQGSLQPIDDIRQILADFHRKISDLD